jgi:hypothetical protein
VFHTVVGVIADIKLRDLTEGQQSVGAYYFSTDQEVPGFLTFAVKTAGDPLSILAVARIIVERGPRRVDLRERLPTRIGRASATWATLVVFALFLGRHRFCGGATAQVTRGQPIFRFRSLVRRLLGWARCFYSGEQEALCVGQSSGLGC